MQIRHSVLGEKPQSSFSLYFVMCGCDIQSAAKRMFNLYICMRRWLQPVKSLRFSLLLNSMIMNNSNLLLNINIFTCNSLD